MAESLSLTTPIAGQAAINVLRPSNISLDTIGKRIVVKLTEWNGSAFVVDGRFKEFIYDDSTVPTGISLIISLNKANLATISLEKRIMNQLVSSGFIAGTISGVPE